MPFFLSSIIKGYTVLSFSAIWTGSTLLAILSSLIKVNVYTVILRNSLIRVYTIYHSQQSDRGLRCLPFSKADWLGSTLFAILSSLIMIFTICHSQQSDQGQGLHRHSQEHSDQVLHYLPFSAVWSWSSLFAILSSLIKVKVYTVILRNSLIRFYTIYHYQQPDQGLHCLPFSAVWSGSTLLAILSSLFRVTLFPIISSLIRVYTVCHSQFDQDLHCLPFSAVWSKSTLFAILSSLTSGYIICHSQQSDQGLHYLPFSAVWSGSTLFAILSGLIRVYTVWHSQKSLIRVYNICHSQQSDQGLHYLQFFLSSIIKV